jgi:hypothetical protein
LATSYVVLEPAQPRQRGSGTSTTEAERWVAGYLADHGRVRSIDVKDAGESAGFSKSAIERAFRKLGVIAESEGYPRVTWWSLPRSRQETHGTAASDVTDATDVTGAEPNEDVANAAELNGNVRGADASVTSVTSIAPLADQSDALEECPDCGASYGKTGKCVPCIVRRSALTAGQREQSPEQQTA